MLCKNCGCEVYCHATSGSSVWFHRHNLRASCETVAEPGDPSEIKRLELERDTARGLLSLAALELPEFAGPVHGRIVRLKEHYAKALEKVKHEDSRKAR